MNALVSLLFFERLTLVYLQIISVPFQYKVRLIKTLIDRAYKINNTTHYFET